MQILMFVLLGICSYTDIKERKISMKVLLFFFCIMGIWLMLSERKILSTEWLYPIRTREALAGLLPGAALLISSKLFCAGIGEGDGYFLMLAGWMLGIRNVFLLLFGGLLLAAGYALILLLFQKKKKSETFPFIPFLFAAYILLTTLVPQITENQII